MNIEKIIRTTTTYTETGYLDNDRKLIRHSFDDEPAFIYGNYSKTWYKDGLAHRDNNLPAIIWVDGDSSLYKNGKQYWFINNEEEYYDIEKVKEKFKNNILTLTNVNTNILKENNIDAIWLTLSYYIILDQSQYNLAIFKFL